MYRRRDCLQTLSYRKFCENSGAPNDNLRGNMCSGQSNCSNNGSVKVLGR